MQHLAI